MKKASLGMCFLSGVMLSLWFIGGTAIAAAQTSPPTASAWKTPIPTEAKNQYKQANDLYHQGKFTEALAEIRQALTLAPNYVEAHLRYVDIQLQITSQPMTVAEEYRTKMAREPRNPVYPLVLVLGTRLASSQAEQEHLCAKITESAPDWSWTQNALGHLYSRKDKEKALGAYRKAVELEPENCEHLAWVARLLTQMKQYDEAMATCRKMLQIDPTQYFTYSLLWRNQLAKANNAPETRTQIEQELAALKAREKKSPEFLSFLGDLYQGTLKDRAKAKIAQEELKNTFPGWSKTQNVEWYTTYNCTGLLREFVLAGQRYALSERIDEAESGKESADRIAAFEAIVKDPIDDDVRAYCSEALVKAYGETHEIGKMDAAAQTVLKLDPEDIGVLSQVAEEMLAQKQNLPQALKYAERLTQATKAFTQAKRPKNFDTAYWEEEFPEKTQREQYLKRRATYLHTLGWAYLELGKYIPAETALRESVKLEDRAENHYRLGLALDKLGKAKDAAEQLATAVAYGEPVESEAREALEALTQQQKSIDGKTLMAAARTRRREALRVVLLKDFVNEPPKDFELTSLSGKKYKLSELHGKPVLVNFWASW